MLEVLEPRRLLSAVYPTANEQLMVELVNRARANPTAEAARYGISLNEGLSAGTISTAAKQPLAINPYITDAARKHSQHQIDTDQFAHDGIGNGTPKTRMEAAGYVFTGTWGYAENIGWSGTYPSTPNQTTTTGELHRALFVDHNYPGRGHRINMLGANFREIGAGVVSGGFTTGSTTYNAVMVTTNFGLSGTNIYLTGVAYTDAITADAFYTPGEGLSNISVQATRASDGAVFSTTTWASGGYSLALPAGTYAVVASGSGLGTVSYGDVTISTQNVKADFTPGSGQSDTTRPTALLTAPSVTAASTIYDFTVRYSDNIAVKAASITTSFLRVTGPNGFSANATLIGTDRSINSTPIVANYRITPPGGFWTSADNGSYTVSLLTPPSDTSDNTVVTGALGTFSVSVAADLAGNDRANAHNIGTFTIGRRKSSYDRVEPLDKNDFFRFKVLAGGVTINVRLDQLTDDANVQLIRSNGDPMRTSARTGATPEVFSYALKEGTWFLRVYNVKNSATNYRLRVDATPFAMATAAPMVMSPSAKVFSPLFSSTKFSDESLAGLLV